MAKVVFHSFYSDPTLSSLKHALLYYGTLSIPSTDFLYHREFERAGSYANLIQTIPNHVSKEIEYLESQNIVEYFDPRGGKQSPEEMSEVISSKLHKEANPTKKPMYDWNQLAPVFRYLNINPKHPDALSIAVDITNFLSCIMLSNVASSSAPLSLIIG